VAEPESKKNILNDPDFVRRVFCYLENRISSADLTALQGELLNSTFKQEAFIELCLTRRGVIEVVRSRSESSNQIRQTADLTGPSDAAQGLSETMIMPAITAADDEPQEMILPGPTILGSRHPQHGRPSKWKQRSIRAAAILLPLLAGLLIWRSLGGGKQPSSDKGIPQIATVPEPVATTQLAPPSVTAQALTLPDDPVPTPQPALASVTFSLNAGWDRTGSQLPPGSELSSGPHTLDSGMAQITLSGGAAIVLQAPVRFEVTSQSHVSLVSGQISAKVPHDSKGLSVQSPDVLITDLGTEFGMNAVPKDQTHVEVFDGRVRAELPADQNGTVVSRIINADRAVAVKTGSSTIESDVPTPLEFVRSDELQARTIAGGDQAMLRWKAFSDTMRRDPDLIAYYTFDHQATLPGLLINQSLLTRGKHNGILGMPDVPDSSPQWSQGRWAQKGALKFGDHSSTAVIIPGNASLTPASPMSIAFWVKRSELKLPVHLINQGDGAQGTFNVSLMGTSGKPRLGLQPQSIYFNFGEGTEISMRRQLPADDNWFFVTIVVGSDRNTRFYTNGKPASQSPILIPGNLNRTGDLCIGRASPAAKNAETADIFRGWMDELAIFRRALSDQEVQRMYAAGNTD
jgi:hypothetical protein